MQALGFTFLLDGVFGVHFAVYYFAGSSLDPDWLIYSNPVIRIEASQSTLNSRLLYSTIADLAA